ncbi:MAG TPA: hypothetical protein VFW98_13455 [Gemmatimonadaceae bacterium]|nr:hypothetical protein [Gemmatimonadaceae bacterium]
MQYVHHAGYALREFYARNPRLAPKPSARRKRLVAYALIALMLAGTAASMYLTPVGAHSGPLRAFVQQHLLGGATH